MFEFIKGNSRSPTGNLLAYSVVDGYNPIEPGGKIIACNVMVSFVTAPSNHFPVVVFPPVYLKTAEELAELIHLQEDYDVLKLADFKAPSKTSADEYIKKRLKKFNDVVIAYVEMCRDYIQYRMASFTPEMVTPLLTDEIGSSVTDESSLLDILEGYIEKDRPVTAGNKDKFRHIIQQIELHYPRYDIRNLERVLKSYAQGNNEELARLYIKKFRAIYAEEYEKAAAIQNHIRVIEESETIV